MNAATVEDIPSMGLPVSRSAHAVPAASRRRAAPADLIGPVHCVSVPRNCHLDPARTADLCFVLGRHTSGVDSVTASMACFLPGLAASQPLLRHAAAPRHPDVKSRTESMRLFRSSIQRTPRIRPPLFECFDRFGSRIEAAASRKFDSRGFDADKYEGMLAIRLTFEDLT